MPIVPRITDVRPLEDPQQVEEEVEVPIGPRDEVDRARVGRRVVELAEPARLAGVVVARRRVLPDDREPDDHADDDERHDRVVPHRVREERLPALLDVLLVLLEDPAALDDRGRWPSASPPAAMPGKAGALAVAASRSSSSGPVPAASFDHGGDVTPSRTTRYRCSPISAKIEPGISSMWIA